MREAKDGLQNRSRHQTMMGTGSAVLSLLSASLAFANPNAQFKSFETHSHFVVPVDPSVTYTVSKVEKQGKVVALRLMLENVDPETFTGSGPVAGMAPDMRTEKILMALGRAESGTRVAFDIALSPKAQDAGVEFFDYRNKAPTEIVVDYWLKSQKASSAKAEKAKTEAAAHKKVAAEKKAKAVAKAAAAKKVTGIAVYGGCGQPLDPATDGIALWKVYHKPFDYQGYFSVIPADTSYTYPVPVKDPKTGEFSREAAHYKLALKLYKEGQYALVLRTIEFFLTQFPHSKWGSELEFLRGNTLIQLSRLLRTDRYVDQAIDVFRRVLLTGPETEKGKLALAFVVQEYMTRGNSIAALEYALIGAGPTEPVADPKDQAVVVRSVYRLASAEALASLGELDRSERAYQFLIDQNNSISPEAAFRVGELLSMRKLWERAVVSYERAIKQFPKEAEGFSTVWLNLAEAYFRQGKLQDSERVYRQFVEKFPSDGAAWAAQLRLAELDQMKIKIADIKKHDQVQKSYEDVINDNPYTPGSMMAELRLARCWKGLSADDRTRNFFATFFKNRELKKFESVLIDSREIEAWYDLTEAKFFVDNGDLRAALQRADDYRSKLEKLGPMAASFKTVFSKAVTTLVQDLGRESDGGLGTDTSSEILALVEHYGDLVSKPEPVDYSLAIARAMLAKNNLKATGEILARIESSLANGASSGAERDDFWALKARYNRLVGEKPDRVMSDLAHIDDNGTMAVVKYDELAHAALDKNDLRAALTYDNRLLDTDLAKKAPVQMAIDASVRRIDTLARLHDLTSVVRLADQTLLKFGAHTEYAALLGRARDIRAQALYDSGRFPSAVEALDEILLNQPNHPRRNELSFLRAKALSKLGRQDEALDAYKKLAQATSDDIWKKSAQAELEQINWETNLKKQTGGLNDRNSN